MKRRFLTHEQIYKTYKHGGSLKGIDVLSIWSALKLYELQVVLVKDKNDKRRVYNFVPETNRWSLVAKE